MQEFVVGSRAVISSDLQQLMNYVLERMAKVVRMYLGGLCVFDICCDFFSNSQSLLPFKFKFFLVLVFIVYIV